MIYIMQNNRMRVLTDAEVQAIRDDGTIGTPAARDTIDALDDAKPTAEEEEGQAISEARYDV